jgi:radical SAM superfamily enzyme YgiQ (UPF0313 family)
MSRCDWGGCRSKAASHSAAASLCRPDTTLDLLAVCGLREVALGIESGSERMLAYIDKRITREMILSVAQRLTSRGIRIKRGPVSS